MKNQGPVLGYGKFVNESTNRQLDSLKDQIANQIISIKSLNERIDRINTKPSKVFLDAIASDLKNLVKKTKNILVLGKTLSGLSEEERSGLKQSLTDLQTKIDDVSNKATKMISDAEKLKDPNMRLVNFKDLDTWSNLSAQKNIGDKASSKTTPLYNLITESGYEIVADLYRGNRQGPNGSFINVDETTPNAYTINIAKLWTEQLLEDSYEENWREDAEAIALLGKPIESNYGENEFIFNYFTSYNNHKELAFLEKALEYAKENYLVYQHLNIHAHDGSDLLSEKDETLVSYAKHMGMTLDSINDLPKVRTLCYRAYQDNKAIDLAKEFFGHQLLKDITGYKS